MPSLTPQQIEDAARAMPDHTLATSFLEPDARARVISLLLFAHEVARARSVVSEPGLAAIRLQWWRDCIEEIYVGNAVRKQPTAIALAACIQEADLPRHLLDTLIDGYEKELDSLPFETWDDLLTYLDQTHGNLFRLSLLASGLPSITSTIDSLARAAGTAWGLAHLIRVMPQWLMRRSIWLPQQNFGLIDLEAAFAGEVRAGLNDGLAQTEERLIAAQKLANSALSQVKLGQYFPALAIVSLARIYGRRARPKMGPTWQIAPEITLFERQIRLTLSVALARF